MPMKSTEGDMMLKLTVCRKSGAMVLGRITLCCVMGVRAERAIAAGTCASGTINVIHVARPAPLSFGEYAAEVTLNRTATWGGPSCTGTGNWGLSLKDAGGRALYATLLTAQAAGKTVVLCGTGLCTVIGNNDAEDLAHIDVYP
jgi:hypothetical protein